MKRLTFLDFWHRDCVTGAATGVNDDREVRLDTPRKQRLFLSSDKHRQTLGAITVDLVLLSLSSHEVLGAANLNILIGKPCKIQRVAYFDGRNNGTD